MTKLRRKILGGMSVIAVTGAVAATGLTVASASQAAGSPGFEQLQIMNTSGAPNASSSIIARGNLFTAGGTVAGINGSSAKNTVTFPDGTFVITHSPGTGTPHFNGKTCLATFALNGTYRLSGGTGAYAGISGHGIYRLNITIIAARNSAGRCTNKNEAYQQIIRAQGPAKL